MTLVSSAHANGDRNGSGLPKVPSIPLADDRAYAEAGDQSIGTLVKDATTHLSTLVRAEVELAKSEVTGEIKKGLKGSIFFIVALTVLLYSSFFLFFALAELLADLGLVRSAAFGIVFGLMLVIAGLFGFLGWRKVRAIRAPQRTISSMKDTAAAITHRGEHSGNGHVPARR
ncbi:Putative Holin-X, holin superfamily III [Actinokineospora alba]|uniref:Putative Holin-X, holin superfamily III n=1 Tax=Actinokineospora alba TaxID=504798 RepID=A0A1H0T092_9PSEU|nr:phage holin family protein [Actinokineospora alba]TDP66441.1 putative superfamily III holin-X [Actinokineospora alba]SDJ51785.1 Putative Holin-X, holin superfamily III [Actinokineospora alba]SDP47394.1 Putative Holin-X, holin superfamily III [Actinokineospora alba]